jgi:hypothetical protein
MRPFLLLIALLVSPALAQEFSLAQTQIIDHQPAVFAARPSASELLFGPLPEGNRGTAIAARLLLWSIPWTIAGSIGGLASSDPLARNFWLTNSLWAGVNSAIALVGLLGSEPSPKDLQTVLYINAGLDVLYVAAGSVLALRSEAHLQGMGWAIVLQGAFLLIFDLWHGLGLN